jgi:hypothetical protein
MHAQGRGVRLTIATPQADPTAHWTHLWQSTKARSISAAVNPEASIKQTASKAARGGQPAATAAPKAKSKGVGDADGVTVAVI